MSKLSERLKDCQIKMAVGDFDELDITGEIIVEVQAMEAKLTLASQIITERAIIIREQNKQLAQYE